MRVNVVPLSVNKCWKGKRFKTPEYKAYEGKLMILLKRVDLPKPPFEIHFKFGFSSKLSDWDNPIKPLQDVLQKKYKFDDRDVFKATVEKEIVEKGSEYLEFNIKSYLK